MTLPPAPTPSGTSPTTRDTKYYALPFERHLEDHHIFLNHDALPEVDKLQALMQPRPAEILCEENLKSVKAINRAGRAMKP